MSGDIVFRCNESEGTDRIVPFGVLTSFVGEESEPSVFILLKETGERVPEGPRIWVLSSIPTKHGSFWTSYFLISHHISSP